MCSLLWLACGASAETWVPGSQVSWRQTFETFQSGFLAVWIAHKQIYNWTAQPLVCMLIHIYLSFWFELQFSVACQFVAWGKCWNLRVGSFVPGSSPWRCQGPKSSRRGCFDCKQNRNFFTLVNLKIFKGFTLRLVGQVLKTCELAALCQEAVHEDAKGPNRPTEAIYFCKSVSWSRRNEAVFQS